MGGLYAASGWLMSILLALFVIASGWLHRFYWRYLFFAIASGWLVHSQWVAYVDFIGIICYSQWVVCTGPLTLCVLASGWLAQFHLVSFSFISFTYSASGWPGCSQWVVYAVSFVFLIFPVLDRSVWAALGLKRAAPKVCVFSCWDKLRFRGE